jgi:hypothetical protein
MIRTLALLLVFAGSLSAQTTVDAGIALGRQSYKSSSDDPKVLYSADVLLLRNAIGAHVAGEYAKLTEEGSLLVTHADLAYRIPLGQGFVLLLGAGPTFVSFGSKVTANAEVELGRRWNRTELFVRVRQYRFNLPRFREGEAGPRGPAVYLGLRFRVK